jgi:septum formation protein
MTVILASASRIRRELLERAGVKASIVIPHFDEDQAKEQLAQRTVLEMALELAAQKALAVKNPPPGAIVIGADQILECEGQCFDKPDSPAAALFHLRALRGRTHHLISAIACIVNGECVWSHVKTAELTMREFSDEFLEDYLAAMGNKATHSVGAYELEGLGAQLFESVRGDYFTILGLPLIPLLEFLRERGELKS